MEDVVGFFERFYNPSNAVLCIAGDISFETAFGLCQKWFGDIPAGPANKNLYPIEPLRTAREELSVESDVPQDAIYMAFPMVKRMDAKYFAFDLLSDILSGSESSRFTNILVREKGLFTHVHAYITGDIDAGLFVVEGKLSGKCSFEEAEESVLHIIRDLVEHGLNEKELEKVKNKSVTSNLFAKTSVLNKAMGLCYSYRLGNIELINTEIETIKQLKPEDIVGVCRDYILKGNQAVIKYKSKT